MQTSLNATSSPTARPSALARRYEGVRATTERLAEPLGAEDQVVQSMPDASPTKWHRAHTTWFFETFVLRPHQPGYRVWDARWGYLFNSYYEAMGERHPRPARGMLTRPTVGQIADYRAHVDEAMARLLARGLDEEVAALVELGLHHEQQHQELLLTDILHALSCNPLRPAYRDDLTAPEPAEAAPLEWLSFQGGVVEIGHAGEGFAFDNEGPRHEVLLRPFRLASRLVTNGEWKAFIADGGYERPELWLSDGWATVQRQGWAAPLYWERRDGQWLQLGLGGVAPVCDAEPVRHVSGYEADAFARWAGKRLPSETEWELAARALEPVGNLLGSGALRPLRARGPAGTLLQAFGDVWEHTRSPYGPYPGYRTPAGAVGEYNGKFMCNQRVLRGGSCLTPPGHVRATYRNFFYPHQRWQMTGLRLAEDLQ